MWTIIVIIFLLLMLQELLEFLGDVLALGILLLIFLALRLEFGDFLWRFGLTIVQSFYKFVLF